MAEERSIVCLISSDKYEFQVDQEIAVRSTVLKHLIEFHGDVNDHEDRTPKKIPILEVDGKTLENVLEWCHRRHATAAGVKDGGAGNDRKFGIWEAAFLEDLDMEDLISLMNAANYLNIEKLVRVTSRKVGDKIKDLEVEEVRKIFNITNDHTKKEENEIRQKYKWAFE